MKRVLEKSLKFVCLVGLLVAVGCGNSAPPPPAADPGLEVVRRYTQMFYSGETEKLRENFSEEMKDEFPEGRLQVMLDRVRLNLGEEIEVVGEDSQTRDDYRGFVRWARFSKHEGVVEIQWVLREDDTVAGFIIRETQDGGN